MNTHEAYTITDPSPLLSPSLLFFPELIRQNLARTLELAGDPARLRLHVKTHKTPAIVQLEREMGITKHKCATIAECEMVAQCGPADILLSYPLVGPNPERFARLIQQYPESRFAATVDHAQGVKALQQAAERVGVEIDVMLDVDIGQHRTGISPGPEAVAVYEAIAAAKRLHPTGLHVYDGHNHQTDLTERQAAALKQFEAALRLRETLQAKGLPVPRVVVGGTPTFPIYARLEVPGLECSPGTLVLHDHGYGSKFADLSGFVPAALLLTRVISRPTPTRVTWDLGYKAVASDPGPGKRLRILGIQSYEEVLQNEEHLVIDTPDAAQFHLGDAYLAVPTHICPTVALHSHAAVIEAGRLTGYWPITARDRQLSI
ncbi:MAG: D-TA family PLP-dependent enzyme [Gemmataceae bacterium]